MNGTLLFRRSASMVLASSLWLATACGVEFNGLFEGDADVDAGSPRDAAPDPSFVDRGTDTTADINANDNITDVGATDGSPEDRGVADATGDPASDRITETDVARDVGSGDGRDVSAPGDALADGRLDTGVMDVSSDPGQDTTAGDTATEPKIDVTPDAPPDVVADARDASADRPDTGPPGTCSGACNTFDNISQTITRTVDQGSPPTMTGGTLVDGTYVATSVVQYNGDMTAYTIKETSVIAGNMDAWVSSTNGQAEARYTTTFTTTNNQLAFTFCCPNSGNLTILYTTDGNTISHVDPGNPNRVITYTRQ